MDESRHPQTANRILASLPTEDYQRIAAILEPVELKHGQKIYEAEELIEDVYFPANSMISLVSQMSDGASVEVGIVGFEGMAGVSFFLGAESAPHSCVVQIPDGAMRGDAQKMRAEFKRGGAFQDLTLRYVYSLLRMTSQVAACNRLHSLSERLARWLLMSQDRCALNDLPLTQEFLSIMLGVRRAGVTEAAIILQTEGMISYKRGQIKITDRRGLEEFCCECYRIIKRDFDRIVS